MSSIPTATSRRRPRPTGEAPLANEVYGLLLQVMQQQRRSWFSRVAAETGLSFPQSFALQQLNPDGPESMRALAERCQVDPSAITGLVDRLEGKGLVERRPDPDDRRVKALVLTPEGRRVRDHLRSIMAEPPPSLSRVSPERLRTVRDVLTVLASAE